MQALIDLIEKYRPGFARSIVPSSEEGIELLEDAVGPLPGAYRRFLAAMGDGMGDFEVDEATFRASSMRAAHRSMPWLKRDRFLLVALDGSEAVWDYYFDRVQPHGTDDFMIVRLRRDPDFDARHGRVFQAGLEELLYYEAFRTVRLPLFDHRVRLWQPADERLARFCSPEAACALIEKLGFERIAPATRCALYERTDAAILLYQHPISPTFSFDLACDDSRELARLAAIYRAELGVTNGP